VFVTDDEIRRSLHDARVESIRRSMAAASRSEPRRRPLRLVVGLRLISAGERLARSSVPSEVFAP
jgi:hypothetical protein